MNQYNELPYREQLEILRTARKQFNDALEGQLNRPLLQVDIRAVEFLKRKIEQCDRDIARLEEK